jgi:8-oxo-dGTP pyrophosphatase MutT (NUDIX family)
MSGDPELFHVGRVELAFKPKPWVFAAERRAEIDAYFAELRRAKPSIWNGRVLLMHHQVMRGGVLYGDYLETDYASFSAWRAWGRPPAGVRDCFGAGAIIASDGACLLGVMGAHTFHAGDIYFPCGTPDPNDLAGTTVDLESSVWREVREETGLDAGDLAAEPGWTAVVDGSLIGLVKTLHAAEPAEALRTRIIARLARETQPELSDITVVRGPGDFTRAMPRFVTAFLTQMFAER